MVVSTVMATKNPLSFRAYIRQRCGGAGQTMWETLIEIAEGRAWTPQWVDQRGTVHYGEPQTPTSTDRRLAAQAVLEHLHGKAVPEYEIVKAEEASQDMQRIRAMSDEDLVKELERIKARPALDAGPEVDAECVPVSAARADLFD